MFKGIIFDLYGTLIRLAQKSNPYRHFFKDLQVETSAAVNVALTEDFASFAELAHRLAPEHGIDDFAIYEQQLQQEIATAVLYPETLKVLAKIRGKNIRLAVISNLASPYRQPYFTLGLDALFNIYLFSCEVRLKKPDPRIYQLVTESWGCLSQDILMVGDSFRCDVQGPKKLGMQAILLQRERKHSSVAEQIDSLCDLLGIL